MYYCFITIVDNIIYIFSRYLSLKLTVRCIRICFYYIKAYALNSMLYLIIPLLGFLFSSLGSSEAP